MNQSELYSFLESSPKKVRKIKLNKSPIFLDLNIRYELDDYYNISDKKLKKGMILLKTINLLEIKYLLAIKNKF